MNETEMTFEAALARLEEIVRELENGAAPLDQSLMLFEEGVRLVKLCGNRLDEAEQKIRILMKKEDGSYEERPFGQDQG
ncbi:MAG: exodeoxyribonuclease VII small subunit [Ruminococcaceae bacterium]|nr:exodeoxyribonuclease VII small subunit [Oscillospiraceae bacterium]